MQCINNHVVSLGLNGGACQLLPVLVQESHSPFVIIMTLHVAWEVTDSTCHWLLSDVTSLHPGPLTNPRSQGQQTLIFGSCKDLTVPSTDSHGAYSQRSEDRYLEETQQTAPLTRVGREKLQPIINHQTTKSKYFQGFQNYCTYMF